MKKQFLTSLAALACSGLLIAEPVVQIPNNLINQKLLKEMDLDYTCMGSSREFLRFHMNEHAQNELENRKFFKTHLLKHSTTAVENPEEQFEVFARQENLGIYHTYEEMVEELEAVAANYPGLATLRVGATSHEGRAIYVLEITKKDCGIDKINYLVTGTHHAREWISTEVPLAYIEYLTSGYGSDEAVTALLDNTRIVFVPMLNPDGGVFSRTSSRMWRKNRRQPEGESYVGVDNNRNYPYQWGGAGASSWSGSNTYHGPTPASEIETQLVLQLQEEFEFTAAVSCHSYSELVLWPYGYTSSIQAPDHDIFALYGNQMGAIMGYDPMQASHLYSAAGIFDDTLYAEHGVLAYTFELGTQFIPSESQVPQIEEKAIKALMYLFTNATDPFGGVNQNTPIRKLMRKLERLVFLIEGTPQGDDMIKLYDSLLDSKESEIEEAMEGLAMKETMRQKIIDGLTSHKKHYKLYPKGS